MNQFIEIKKKFQKYLNAHVLGKKQQSGLVPVPIHELWLHLLKQTELQSHQSLR